MDNMTIFKKKDGNVSSYRFKGAGGLSSTLYPGSSRGGVTIRTGSLTTRLTGSGVIGSGMKTGSRTVYYGAGGRRTDRLTSF